MPPRLFLALPFLLLPFAACTAHRSPPTTAPSETPFPLLRARVLPPRFPTAEDLDLALFYRRRQLADDTAAAPNKPARLRALDRYTADIASLTNDLNAHPEYLDILCKSLLAAATADASVERLRLAAHQPLDPDLLTESFSKNTATAATPAAAVLVTAEQNTLTAVSQKETIVALTPEFARVKFHVQKDLLAAHLLAARTQSERATAAADFVQQTTADVNHFLHRTADRPYDPTFEAHAAFAHALAAIITHDPAAPAAIATASSTLESAAAFIQTHPFRLDDPLPDTYAHLELVEDRLLLHRLLTTAH